MWANVGLHMVQIESQLITNQQPSPLPLHHFPPLLPFTLSSFSSSLPSFYDEVYAGKTSYYSLELSVWCKAMYSAFSCCVNFASPYFSQKPSLFLLQAVIAPFYWSKLSLLLVFFILCCCCSCPVLWVIFLQFELFPLVYVMMWVTVNVFLSCCLSQNLMH